MSASKRRTTCGSERVARTRASFSSSSMGGASGPTSTSLSACTPRNRWRTRYTSPYAPAPRNDSTSYVFRMTAPDASCGLLGADANVLKTARWLFVPRQDAHQVQADGAERVDVLPVKRLPTACEERCCLA